MIDGYKIVTGGPVGRKKYFEIQVKYLLKLRHLIDEHHLWINTNNKEDLNYFDELCYSYPDFFKKITVPFDEQAGYSTQNVCHFYTLFNDPETIYCKIDDDIVFMEVEAFEGYIKHRIQNPQYFLTFPNIINNPLNHFILQHTGAFSCKYFPAVKYDSTNHAWSDYRYAMNSFYQFETHRKAKELNKLKFDDWVLCDYERHSINFMAWFGKDFAKIEKVGYQDEPWMTQIKPAELEKPNCIYGKFIVVHYAFNVQREKLDLNKDILDYFYKLSDKYFED